ncbi:hypothetical protein [Devosia sp. 2618]|uniref:hypothetical protein n=1 Tax=Devosia sp. 2618 TaxID=3156454 RepID=UPI003394AF8E
MPRKSRPVVTHTLAAQHEALWLKLTALHTQIAPIATRKPQTPVCAHTITVAEALLRDALPFVEDNDRLPMAAPDHGGLVTQLGQTLAEMDSWEAANSRWDGPRNAYLWQVRGGDVLPVLRLRPKLMVPAGSAADPAQVAKMLDLRAKLAKRIDQFKNR